VRRLAFRCLLVAIATPALLQAAPPDGPSRLFEGRDIFALQWATQPRIRPDGSTVAYVRNSYDIMTDRAKAAIWLVDTNTATQTPLVTDSAGISALAWSPDGTRLAYVASAGKEPPRLYVRWMASGQSAAPSDLIDAPEELTWSPDGRSIAFTAFVPDDKAKLGTAPKAPEGAHWADPLQVVSDVTYRADGAGYLKTGYTHAFVTSADGGAPRQLTFGSFNESGPLSFSTDGRFLFMSGNRMPDWRREPVHTEIYKVSIADGALTAVTDRVGPNDAPLVSSDGAHIAYLGFDDHGSSYQDTHLYVMDGDGGHPHLLGGQLDRSIQKARWASDSRSLYIQYDDQGITKVSRIHLDGHVEPVTQGLAGGGLDRPYTGGDFSVATNGTVAFMSGNAQAPSEVSIVYHARVRELTHLNDTFLADKTLAKIEPLPVQSAFDHRTIGAWIVMPPNFDASHKYPLILEIHGGPFAAYGPLFSTDDQLYAAAGYVVVYANPRGSTSYGEAFADLINHDYPSHDYDDLMSVVDAAIARGFVDPQNLFVTGGSGGGLLTAWIVGHTDRFRAAASQKPVINWMSEVLTTDVYTFMGRYWFGKQPWQDPHIYWQHSPLSFAGCVSTPTLVIVGDQDYRTPVSDAEQYFAALQLREVPTELIKVPGASHGGLAGRPSQSAAKASAILSWFERYRLKGGTVDAETNPHRSGPSAAECSAAVAH
jgi:dipeptidyl aminopeptidase/acylaminoacyl peptidase